MTSKMLSATPILASLNIQRSVEFFTRELGFDSPYIDQGRYGTVSSGPVHIHFWACSEKHIAENTACRIVVDDIEALYAKCLGKPFVHPNAPLSVKPWGTKEFGVLDPDGNLITFVQDIQN
jgi:catechol 2,3-dioxygenase-like lactoylglutathione lyase family enzyme